MARTRKSEVPLSEYQAVLRGYGARALPEYSNHRRHVYYSAALQNYIIVRRPKGSDSAELEFTPECPCGTDD